MLLRNKVILLLGLTFIAVAIIFNVDAIFLSSTYLTISAIALISLLYISLSKLIVNRIIKLKKQLLHVDFKSSAKQSLLPVDGYDEIADVIKEINRLISEFHEIHDDNEKKSASTINELQQKLSLLQKELLTIQANEKRQISSRECLTQLARYDALTTLPNRIFFNEILNKALSHAKRRDKILAILFINLDTFATLNNNLGHNVGDFVLKELANRFVHALRSEDIVAKLEGDEFIILLNDINKPKFASTVAEKILKACELPIKFENHEIHLTASIGICIFPNDGSSLETLFKCAELSLQKAKSEGGNRYQFYTQAMDVEAKEYIQLEGALRKALAEKQLTLYFQPKLHLKKGTLIGVEALIRWTHPELGIINPSKFIPLAEETNLIMQIGEWALREACKINKFWQDEGYEHLSIAVNISPKQFQHPHIVDIIESALKETGLHPSYLELEINESTIMTDMASAAQKLEAIKAIGVEISIDHFGLGYTSISQLKYLPITSIKIDQNFIKGIPLKPNDLAITSAIIALAHNLGLMVVAEGVETAEQVQYLANLNCDIIQGYFLSHPLPSQKIILQFRKLMDGAII